MRDEAAGPSPPRTRPSALHDVPGFAWLAVWRAQRANPVYRARYQHLTGRQINKLRPTQAQTVIAAAILRHLHAAITTGQAWDPMIATLAKHRQALPAA